jgi:hypothetical protein
MPAASKPVNYSLTCCGLERQREKVNSLNLLSLETEALFAFSRSRAMFIQIYYFVLVSSDPEGEKQLDEFLVD